jgi:AcrR family transcriptional regulator
VFDRFGFHGTGMDVIVQAARVSSRTLYKRFGSKERLICAVLQQREDRFFAGLRGDGIASLFENLARWAQREGGRGCLYLRALGEFGERGGPILERIDAYHERLRSEIKRRINHELREAKIGTAGLDGKLLVERILLLFEGAATVCSYEGSEAARRAGQAAIAFIKIHRKKRRNDG